MIPFQVKDEKPPAPIRKLFDEEDEEEDEDTAEADESTDGGSAATINLADLVDRNNIRLVERLLPTI